MGLARISFSYQYYLDLIQVLVGKELKIRYKGTVLGYAWSILHPLVFALVYFVVFKIVMRIKMDNYALFLISGLFPWQWFSNSVAASNFFFLGNSSLIKKVRFPRELLVFSGVLNDLIHFVAAIPVIFAFMLYYHVYPACSWLYQIPLLIGVQLAFTYGLSLMLATWNLFFRDLERISSLVLMLWFFLTPVLFPMDMVPEQYHWALYLNPMAATTICWRSVFLEGVLPIDFFSVAVAYAVLTYSLGQAVFKRLVWRFAEIV